MADYAFYVPLNEGLSEADVLSCQLADGLSREVVFFQEWAPPACLVVYQQGPRAGQVTSLPGVEIPKAELVFTAGPDDLPGTELHLVAPLLAAGMTEQWLRFCRDVSTDKRAQLQAQRERVGMSEQVFLQRGSRDRVVAVITGADPADEGMKIGSSDDPFDIWFVEQLTRFHGLDTAAAEDLPAPNRLLIDLGGDNG